MTAAPPPGNAWEPRPAGACASLIAWLWGEQGQAGEYLLAGHPVTARCRRGCRVTTGTAGEWRHYHR